MKKKALKKILKRISSTFFAALILLTLIGCGKKSEQVRVGALKGATTIGLLSMMEGTEDSTNSYQFTMAVNADELMPKMITGDLDIALLPANAAAMLYQKSEGAISVIDINTLGVLYLITGNEEVQSIKDLKGKTVYLTGQGTTPDYVLRYLLSENGISEEEVTFEYQSEPTVVASLLFKNSNSIGLLPQPFVTVACTQNTGITTTISLTEEWNRIQGENGSSLVTGVTVVRNDFLKEHPACVTSFLQDHAKSCAYSQTNLDETAALCVKQDIIAKEEIAKKAIPSCNIVCITGEEMKQALAGYLVVLFNQNPKTVGGKLPDNAFYYLGK